MAAAGMSEEHLFSSRAALDLALAQHIASTLQRDIAQRGEASLAVSGGSTPRSMFSHLTGMELEWGRVHITLVDERWVAPDSPDSNERLVREHLLQGKASAAHFTGLKTPHSHAEDGLAATNKVLAEFPLPFTCVVLGMGNDGHTASWFPQASNLSDLLNPDNTNLLGTCDPVTAPHQRITLTLSAVLAAAAIILHITGDEKRAVLQEATEKNYPIAAITGQQRNPVSIWWAP